MLFAYLGSLNWAVGEVYPINKQAGNKQAGDMFALHAADHLFFSTVEARTHERQPTCSGDLISFVHCSRIGAGHSRI